MDPGINAGRVTIDSAAVQLRAQHLQEMRSLIEDYTTQKIELARERDAALAERDRIEREREDVHAALAAETQRTEELQRLLDSTKAELRDGKSYRKNSQKAWKEEKAKIETKTKMYKNKLALTTASLEKRIEQAGQREEDERKDKEGLKRLNEELIAQSHEVQREASNAKAEHDRWILRYSTALSEKIDLLRQYGPTPILPLEILANIASFMAGANDYAGVAAMSATSHLMHAELKPILYETVFWNDAFHVKLHKSLEELAAPEFRHIRFIVLEGQHFSCVSGNHKQALPNLRVIVKQDSLRHAAANDRIEPPVYSAALQILRDTTLCTISSILDHPLWWVSAAGEKLQRRVRGLSHIEISTGATLDIGDSAATNLWKPYRNPILSVRIEKDAEPSAARTERITTSLEAIRKLMLSLELGATLPEIEFCIEDLDSASLDAWISQTREWLILKPKLSVVVQIPCDEPDNEQFRDITRRFQAMYENLWREDVRFRSPGSPSDEPFFRLYTSASDLEVFGFLIASFSREPGVNGFAAIIEGYPPAGQDANIETLFAHHFVLDGDVEPFINGDGDEDDSSGDSSGGSSGDDSSSGDSNSDDEDD